MGHSRVLLTLPFLWIGAGVVLVSSLAPVSVVASELHTKQYRDFVTMDDGRKIWVEADIIDPRAPTKIAMNGLTNSATDSYGILSRTFNQEGYNVIRFDFPGMAETLLASDLGTEDLGFKAQVKVITDIVPKLEKSLKLKGGFDILGQSFSGGILLALASLEPAFVKHYFSSEGTTSVTAFAAYTEPLAGQDTDIHKKIEFIRQNPVLAPMYSKFTDTELYDKIFHNIVMTSYVFAEPEILGRTPEETLLHLEGVYGIARGIRPLHTIDLIPMLDSEIRINLVVSASDQYIPDGVIKKYWDALPARNRGYFVKVYGFGLKHAMLQVIPITSAHISRLTAEPPTHVIPYGAEIEVYQDTNRIHFGRARYNLEDLVNGKVYDESMGINSPNLMATSVKCETLFRRGSK